MKILSIDPGYERMGVAIVKKEDPSSQEILVFSDCVKTSPKSDHHIRLNIIGQELENIISTYNPEELAIETLFFNKNVKTAIKVSEARGVMLFIASKNGLSVHEYSPLQIKVATTGYGKSSKEQVTHMTKHLISVEKEITHDDEWDAIAVGLTHFASRNSFTLKE